MPHWPVAEEHLTLALHFSHYSAYTDEAPLWGTHLIIGALGF